MNVFGLISGGKDSIYSLIKCIENSHKIIAVGHLSPPQTKELDSYMYQSVGSELCSAIAECLDVPYIEDYITGKPINVDLNYIKTDNDEVEDLYRLILTAKQKYPEINAVSSGAILSTYQKNRVEDVCKRLNLTPLNYLWNKDQNILLNEMLNSKMEIHIIKVCTMGLNKDDLMKNLNALKDKLVKLNKDYGVNICGEGGEYESITLDCNIYKKKIIIDEYETVCHSKDIFSPVYYAIIKKYHLENK